MFSIRDWFSANEPLIRKKRLRESPVAGVTGFTFTLNLITPRALGGAVGV
jgi:hypothetical protein